METEHAGTSARSTPSSRPRDVRIAPWLARELLDYLREAGMRERAGVMLGQHDEASTTISGFIFPPQTTSERERCEFDVGCLDVIRDALGSMAGAPGGKSGTNIVGWVHSHPRLTPFMSDLDRATLANWSHLDRRAIALVVDPFLGGSPERRIAWWDNGFDGHYPTFDEPAADVVIVPWQAALMAEAISLRAAAHGRWDVVTAGCVIRRRVIPAQDG